MTDKWVVANRSALRAWTSAVIIAAAVFVAALLLAGVYGGLAWWQARAFVGAVLIQWVAFVVRAMVEFSLDRLARERRS